MSTIASTHYRRDAFSSQLKSKVDNSDPHQDFFFSENNLFFTENRTTRRSRRPSISLPYTTGGIHSQNKHDRHIDSNGKQVLSSTNMLHVTAVLHVRSEDERADTYQYMMRWYIRIYIHNRGFRETVNRLTVDLVQTQSRNWCQTGQPRSPSWTYFVFVVSAFPPMPPTPGAQRGSCKCFLCSTGGKPWFPWFRIECPHTWGTPWRVM